MKTRSLIYMPLLLILGVFSISCEKEDDETAESTRPHFSLNQPDELPDENYDIYSLVIEENYSSDKVVIRQSTITGSHILSDNSVQDHFTDNYQDFDTSLFDVHQELNANEVYFGEQFISNSKEVILISSDELSYIFDGQDVDSNWEEFYTEYANSNGSILFSRIAFNADKTLAVFEISRSYASLGAQSDVVYLKKENGNWVIVETYMAWIS